MAGVLIAMGGNLGDVAATFDAALRELDEHPAIDVVATSSYHGTAAIGDRAGGGFLNAAAELHTGLDPHGLLDVLQSVERRHGRIRELLWGPRTIDLDIVLYDDLVARTERVEIPHPAAWYRRFVLDPLAEIAGDVVHPLKRVTIGTLRERLRARPLPFAVTGGDPTERRQVVETLAAEFPDVQCDEFDPPSPEPVLLAWLGPGDGTSFEALPLVPRLDASAEDDPLPFLRNVLRSALG